MCLRLIIMNDFLKKCANYKTIKKLKNVCIILGNESCDLDSAISTITLAYYYKNNSNKFVNNQQIYDDFIPLFNIEREQFPIKTEVKHFFEKNSIDATDLIFLDDIDSAVLETNDIILVDHHVSPYFSKVIEVFDHRPFDPSSNLNEKCYKTINEVGSCATLIGDLYMKLENPKEYENILKFLYAAIVLDTVNFSEKANKARELDFTIAKSIEEIVGVENSQVYRGELFDELVAARADIQTLDSYQILFKDMKIIRSKSGLVQIAIPGYPILVQNYIEMANAAASIEKFGKNQNCCVILLMGMTVTDGGNVTRDLGLININNISLFNNVLAAMQGNSTPDLCLEEHKECDFLNGVFFKQNNIAASRKQILPIIKRLLDEM